MYNCELISLKRKGSNENSLLSEQDAIKSVLDKNGVSLVGSCRAVSATS